MARGTASITFDGGILRAVGDEAEFLRGFDPNDITLTGDGLFIDSAEYTIGIGTDFLATSTGDFTVMGDGILELTGDNAGFDGTTIVFGGTLRVGDANGNGALGGSLAVADGGTLGGAGTVGTTTIANGGTLAPGHSIGGLTVDGDLTFEAGSVYEVEVDPTNGTSDHVQVNGTAYLAGSVAHIGLGSSEDYAPNSQYRILTADTVNGTFDGVTSAFIFLDAELAYDTETAGQHGVDLMLVRNALGFAAPAHTRNQRAVGMGIGSLAGGHGVYDAIVTHTGSDTELRHHYDQLSGELHASVQGALIEDSRWIREAANDRLRAATGSPTAPMETGNPTTRKASTTWVRALGNWGRNDGDGNAAKLDRDTAGVLVGVDVPVSDRVRGGGLVGYTRSDLGARGRGSADVDSVHLGLYAGALLSETDQSELTLRGGAFYGYHQIDSDRRVRINGLNERLEDDRTAHTLHAYGELAYRIDTGAVTLEPFANLAHVHQRASSSREKGGDAALHSASERIDTTFATVGVRPSVELGAGTTRAHLYGSLGWRHAFGDTTPKLNQRFAGGDTFSVAGTPLSRNAAVVEAGVRMDLNPRTSLDLSYHGQVGDGMKDHGGRATMEWRF